MVIALTACASDYGRFYSPVPGVILGQFEAFAGQPSVIASTGDFANDLDTMFTRGFAPVGVSDFNGPVRNVAGALERGKKVGAQYIVVSRQFARTVRGAIPMTTLVPQTTYSNGTVSAYGSGGYASGTYNGTTTTYSQQTSYIPYSVDRYDQKAIFFAPLTKQGVGIKLADIGPRDAQRLGTAKGVIITAVRRGSPAYDADLLPGDVLMAIGDRTVLDRDDAGTRFRAAYGSDVEVKLLRSGSRLKKAIHLPVGGVWN